MAIPRQTGTPEDFKSSVWSTYLQLLIGRGIQIILLKLEKAEVLTFYSWGGFVTPCFQWVTDKIHTYLSPSSEKALMSPGCLSTQYPALRILFPFQKTLLTAGNFCADSQPDNTAVQEGGSPGSLGTHRTGRAKYHSGSLHPLGCGSELPNWKIESPKAS